VNRVERGMPISTRATYAENLGMRKATSAVTLLASIFLVASNSLAAQPDPATADWSVTLLRNLAANSPPEQAVVRPRRADRRSSGKKPGPCAPGRERWRQSNFGGRLPFTKPRMLAMSSIVNKPTHKLITLNLRSRPSLVERRSARYPSMYQVGSRAILAATSFDPPPDS
jgi:hypothetical protein